MTETPFQKFLKSKGIREDTAAKWGVIGVGNEAHFKYPSGTKVRGGLEDGATRTFRFNGTSSLYTQPGRLHTTVFITEGESDCLRLSQELCDNGYGDRVSVVGLSGINGWKPEYARLFDGVEKIRIVLDNDEDYSVRASVDKAFGKLVSDLGRTRCRRIYLPSGVKDVVEFFGGYSFKSFVEIAKPSSTTNYTRLDLAADPPVHEWMVERLICQGDVTLLAGPPGIGKSMVAQALTVAVAEGHSHFLGQKLLVHGPVMYLDKENPQDVIYERLRGFGLTSEGIPNVHYYYRPEALLDRSPEALMDDALLIKPRLIVLDSLTRFHSQDENSAGTMNKLFNEGIIPLSRETGAAVLLLHHTNKMEGGSTYQRIRGSGDISAAPDNTLELLPTVATDLTTGKEKEAIKIVQGKARRTSKGRLPSFWIESNPVGDVSLEVVEDGF
jgi:hypothetical protein